MVAMFHLAWPAVRPFDPRMPLSLSLQAGPDQWLALGLAVLAVAVACGVLLLAARTDMAMFAVAASTGGVALRSEPFHGLLLYDSLGVSALFSRLTMETWVLSGAMLAAGLVVVGLRSALGRFRRRPASVPSVQTLPAGELWQRGIMCLFIAVIVAVALLFLLQQSDDRGQVVFAVSASFFLAMLAANQAAPGPFAPAAVLLPPIVATIVYALDGRTLYPPTPQGWANVKPYAMAMPLDWATFGLAGALLGFRTSARLTELRSTGTTDDGASPRPADAPSAPDKNELTSSDNPTNQTHDAGTTPAPSTERNPVNSMRVGVQLYTLRDFCKTMPDIVQTLKKVRAIGYTAVQVSGVGPVDPMDLAKALQDEGLVVAGTHVGWDRFMKETDAVIATHKAWGTKHAAIGMLPMDYYTPDGLKRFLDELAVVAPKLLAEGLDFSYHNHHVEFVKVAGKTMLDWLYENSDPAQLKAEIDTYWVQAGGGTPQEWVAKLPNRQPMLHLKDYTMAATAGQWLPRFAPVGEGNLNWTAILQAARTANVEWVLVEQDDCYGIDPFDALATSYRNLRALGLE